ncbi:MAG: hypothetical protein H6779_00245 [Candidatus Nomurabacteria bacterium]|nr:MAG: hypothetical protein H6779_00245 [Candidatus Nomurabacteria bacterium]
MCTEPQEPEVGELEISLRKKLLQITTTEEAYNLWCQSDAGYEDLDELLWNKMLELAVNHDDLFIIFNNLVIHYEGEEIKRRNFIRKIFDRADEFDCEIIDSWDKS